jgi:acyl carrier protein
MSEATTRTDTAGVLTEFWQELLDVDAIEPDDHLLELGGNSLIATMLANRIELTWGFRPSMSELMTSSLTELSALCEHSAKQP